MSPTPQPPRNSLTVPVLMGIVFLNMTGSGLVIPLLPFYADVFQAGPWQVTLMFSVFAAGQFFGELYWGRLSDRVGRKPVIIGTLAVSAAAYAALAFAPTIGLAILVRGIAGFFSGNISTIQGYVIDATPPDRRAGRLGLVGSVSSIGFIVGPTFGGLMAVPALGAAGFRPPLLLAAALSVAAACATAAVVHEARQTGQADGKQRPGPLSAVRAAFVDPVLRRLMITTLLSFAGFSAVWSTLGLWGEARFDWGPKEIGWVMALMGLASSFSQGLLAGWSIRRAGESRVVMAALLLAAAFLAFGAAGPPEWLATALILLFVASHTLSQPANLTLVSRAASADQQGATLGANNAAGAAARVAGPVVAGLTFSAVGVWTPMALAACALCLAAATAYSAARILAERGDR
jgi:DHA1 family tetracycline resistance protein-like MFS transporter